MFDMFNMMGKVKEFQAKMAEIQEILGRTSVSAQHPDVDVKVTVNGKKEIIKIAVASDLWLSFNPEQIVDFISNTTNLALKEAENTAKTLMAEKTEGILPNIPGMDLKSLFSK